MHKTEWLDLLSHERNRTQSDTVLRQKPTLTEMSRRQSDNTNTPPKSSITQRLQADLGRSVGVTTPTQLVRLTGLQVQSSNYSQQKCNGKDTHLKICKKNLVISSKVHVVWESLQTINGNVVWDHSPIFQQQKMLYITGWLQVISGYRNVTHFNFSVTSVTTCINA